MDLDALDNSHPIEIPVGHPDEVDEIFDIISYSKGASVIRMLHNWIGNAVRTININSYTVTSQLSFYMFCLISVGTHLATAKFMVFVLPILGLPKRHEPLFEQACIQECLHRRPVGIIGRSKRKASSKGVHASVLYFPNLLYGLRVLQKYILIEKNNFSIHNQNNHKTIVLFSKLSTQKLIDYIF